MDAVIANANDWMKLNKSINQSIHKLYSSDDVTAVVIVFVDVPGKEIIHVKAGNRFFVLDTFQSSVVSEFLCFIRYPTASDVCHVRTV